MKTKITTRTTSKPSATALNAVRHGILSNQLLLPSEPAEEYARLLSDLTAEHEPKTPTEEILVQDIANTIWRKRRLLSAERASVSAGLDDSISRPLKLINESSPITLNLQDTAPVRHLLAMSTSDLSSHKKTLVEALRAIDGHSDTDTILDSIPYSIQKRLDELSELEPLTDIDLIPTTENLIHSELKAIASIEAIRNQAYGSACANINFDVIARYDSGLDRKLLRLLDALFTLQKKRKAEEKAAVTVTAV